ncbi:amino acid adenylation domain-containing protein [Paenibacillus sp.]
MDTLEKHVLLSDARLEKEKEYWLGQFSDFTEMTRISFSPSLKGEGSTEVKTYHFNAPLTQRMHAVSKGSGPALFILLLAGLEYVLHRYTGDETVTVGVPVMLDQADTAVSLNKLMLIRAKIQSGENGRSLIGRIKQSMVEADQHSNFPFTLLLDMLGVEQKDEPHCSIIATLKGVYDPSVADGIGYDCRFEFEHSPEHIGFQIKYDSASYAEWFISQLCIHMEKALAHLLFSPDAEVGFCELMDDDELKLLMPTRTTTDDDLQKVQSIPAMFAEQVQLYPDKVAISAETGVYTYRELNDMANRVACYLHHERQLKPEEHVGIMMHNSAYSIISMLGILKAGGAYVPIDPELPYARMKTMIEDAGIGTILSLRPYLWQLNRLQWELPQFEAYICLDTDQLEDAEELENEFMDQQVWNFVADQATDDISGGAWVNSFTRQDLSRQEMDEYADNIKQKLLPYLKADTRVLEIGCASGISMFTLAPHVGFYYGTDLSSSMIRNCRERVEREGLQHIQLTCMPADQIGQLDEKPFDVIILNSVVQVFKGHHYLRKVLRSALKLLSEEGILFIGDVMDLDSKQTFLQDLQDYATVHPEVNTKTEFDNELFLSRAFFDDLQAEHREIAGVHFTDKIHTIPNELTLYRYDVIVQKGGSIKSSFNRPQRQKHQHDLKWLLSQSHEALDIEVPVDQAAYILYTSGSTGTPKGVVIEHHNVVRLLQTTSTLFSFDHREVWSLFHSTSFDFSVWEIFGALLYGGQLVIVPRELAADTRSFVMFVKDKRISILSQTPSAFYSFTREALQEEVALPDLHTVVFGGEALQTVMLKDWNIRYPEVRLINMYGITETTVHVTYKELSAEDIQRNVSDIGRALPSYQVYVLDPLQRVVPAGVPGEMYVGGSGVAREYHHLEKLTEQKFTAIPLEHSGRVYRTGDLARWNPDGSLEYMGRIDEQVKIRGYRMETGEITSVLLQHAVIEQVVVQVIRAEDNSKELCVYYVANEALSPKELKESIGKKLPPFMVPSYAVQLERIPLTSNGKVDKRKLPDPRLELYREQSFLPPEGSMEEELAQIFANILGVHQVGRHDSFFELGGHSLKATRLVSHIYKHLGCELNLRDIFRFPSICELADYIRGLRSSHPFQHIYTVEPRAYYPLTSAQKRLFILEQFSDIGTSYNMPLVLDVKGPLDPERVRHSYIQLLQRHASLRTAFYMNSDEPVQSVMELDQLAADITFREMPDAQADYVNSYIREFIRPFDLSQPPLVRITLIRFNPDNHLFMLDMHHIVSDGTSLNIWLSEFMSLYQGETLKPLDIQYTDYAVWQQEQQGAELLVQQREYWHQQLAGELPVLQLPTDNARPGVQDFKGNQFTVKIGPKLTEQLNVSSRKHNVTLYMLLLAVYQVMLHRYTGQEDIIVGTPVAGRGHADLEPVIGMFVNTLAIRCKPRSDQSFSSFLEEVKSVSLGAFEHADYPLEELVQELQVKRDSSRNPLFDTMFALQNMERASFRIADLRIEASDYDWKSSKFDLLLQAEQEPNGLAFTFEYATSLFSLSTVERMADVLLQLVEEVTVHPELNIGELKLLTSRGEMELRKQLTGELLTFNGPDSVHAAFKKQVKSTPHRIAIREDEITVSYGELNRRANRLATVLQAQGFEAGMVAAICGERSAMYITGVLAIMKAGGTFVPVDPALPSERIAYMLQDSGAKLLIQCTEELPAAVGIPTVQPDPVMWSEDTEQGELASVPIDISGHPLYIIYTSGTTGTPKGVKLSHHNWLNLFLHHREQSNIRMDGKVLHSSSIGFDVCYQEMLVTLLSGGELIIATDLVKKTPELLIDYIRQQEVQTAFLPTAYFNFLIGEEDVVHELLQGPLEHMVVAGEALVLTPAFIQAYCQSGLMLHNHYGPSETHVVTTMTVNKNEQLRERPSVGRPINNTQCYILDQNQHIVPRGVTGELYIAGASVGLGYVNLDELTAQKFVCNPFKPGTVMYRTGDLARLLPSGDLELNGRADQQVKIRGYRIEPGEITAVMLQHPGIQQAATMVKELADGTKALCSFYTSSEGLEGSELRQHLAEQLPSYMIPSDLIEVSEIPFTPNGKVDLRALAHIDPLKLERLEELILPRSELEEQLFEMFQLILERSDLGTTNDFFEVGGHSLKAMRLVSKIRKELNVDISLKEIFLYPTVQSLAAHVSQVDAPVRVQSIEPANAVQQYPVTSAQQRLYILDQYEGISTAYHLSSALLVEGTLDLQQVHAVYNALLERHESLRTTFHIEGDEPVQIVNPMKMNDLWFRDATGMSNAFVNEMMDAFIRPFHLREAPLMRLGVIQLEQDKHLLLIDMHHMVSDGTSIGILVRDFVDLYHGESLLPLPITYKDFAVWQQQQLQSPHMSEKETFWMNHLSGELPVLQLPMDYKRPAYQQFEGALTYLQLEQELLHDLREVAQQTGTTLYMVMLAAFHILLGKYSGDEDIIVGVPVAGRTHEDVAGIVGMFVNTLPFRTLPEQEKPFVSYLQEVKQQLLEAFEHQDYPLERIIEQIQLQPDPSRNPLFTVTFDMQNMYVPDFSLDGITISPWDSSHISAKFDLSVSVAEQEDGLRCTVEYATSLFRQETLDRMMNQYRVLLESIVSGKENRIGQLNCTPADEADLILNTFNPQLAGTNLQEWIHVAFEQISAVQPEATAVVWQDQMLSYGELNAYANELAHMLLARGVERSDVIAVYMKSSPGTVISILAILKAGAAYLPIDTEYPADRVKLMLRSSGARCIITDDVPIPRAIDVETPVLYYSHADRTLDVALLSGNPDITIEPEDLAYVIYTSGSTGQPKGVMIPHRGLSHLKALYTAHLGITPNDRIPQIANITFDLATFEIFAALTTGGQLHLVPRETSADAVALTELMNLNGITFLMMTPSHLAYLNPEELKTIRMVSTGGEAISVYEYERWSRWFDYANLYGPTETTILATSWLPVPGEDVQTTIPIGKPIAHSRVYILNEDHMLQPMGVAGEIYIAGEGVALGYAGLPEATQQQFVVDPFVPGGRMYRTGDRGRWLAGGNIEFTGRADHQVKVRGYRIETGEIELALLQHSSIREAAVLVKTNERQERYLCAFVVENEPVASPELKHFLSATLPLYMLPAQFVRVSKMPVTTNGKLDKKQLEQMHTEILEETSYLPPQTETQLKLVAMWEKHLQVKPIGIRHNFFEMGGQSLIATRLLSDLKQQLGISLSLRHLYQYQTIEELSQFMEGEAEHDPSRS